MLLLLCFIHGNIRARIYLFYMNTCLAFHVEISPKRFTVATIALLSTFGQTHCALVVCDSDRVTAALHSAFWIFTKMVAAVFSCYMAGATWNCCRLGASSVIQPFTSLQSHFTRSHVRRLHVWLAVTCHLHFWQHDRGLLRATAVTRGWNGYRNKNQHRKLTLAKRILPPLLPGLDRTRELLITGPSLYPWAIPALRMYEEQIDS